MAWQWMYVPGVPAIAIAVIAHVLGYSVVAALLAGGVCLVAVEAIRQHCEKSIGISVHASKAVVSSWRLPGLAIALAVLGFAIAAHLVLIAIYGLYAGADLAKQMNSNRALLSSVAEKEVTGGRTEDVRTLSVLQEMVPASDWAALAPPVKRRALLLEIRSTSGKPLASGKGDMESLGVLLKAGGFEIDQLPAVAPSDAAASVRAFIAKSVEDALNVIYVHAAIETNAATNAKPGAAKKTDVRKVVEQDPRSKALDIAEVAAALSGSGTMGQVLVIDIDGVTGGLTRPDTQEWSVPLNAMVIVHRGGPGNGYAALKEWVSRGVRMEDVNFYFRALSTSLAKDKSTGGNAILNGQILPPPLFAKGALEPSGLDGLTAMHWWESQQPTWGTCSNGPLCLRAMGEMLAGNLREQQASLLEGASSSPAPPSQEARLALSDLPSLVDGLWQKPGLTLVFWVLLTACLSTPFVWLHTARGDSFANNEGAKLSEERESLAAFALDVSKAIAALGDDTYAIVKDSLKAMQKMGGEDREPGNGKPPESSQAAANPTEESPPVTDASEKDRI